MANIENDPTTHTTPELILSSNFDNFLPSIEGFDTITDRATLSDWLESLKDRKEIFRYTGDTEDRTIGEIADTVSTYLDGKLPIDSISRFVGEALGKKIEAVQITELVSQAETLNDIHEIIDKFPLYASEGRPYTIKDFSDGVSVFQATGNGNFITGKYGLREQVAKVLIREA